MIAYDKGLLKVLSYWNLNVPLVFKPLILQLLKVLSYWNLNIGPNNKKPKLLNLKYYHIGI